MAARARSVIPARPGGCGAAQQAPGRLVAALAEGGRPVERAQGRARRSAAPGHPPPALEGGGRVRVGADGGGREVPGPLGGSGGRGLGERTMRPAAARRPTRWRRPPSGSAGGRTRPTPPCRRRMPAASAASSASSSRPAVARAEPDERGRRLGARRGRGDHRGPLPRTQRGESALHPGADPVGDRQGQDHPRQGVARAAEAAGRLDDRERVPARAEEEGLHVLVVQPAPATRRARSAESLRPSGVDLDSVDALEVAGRQLLRARASSIAIPSRHSRLAANRIAAADGGSSQCRSSTATSTGASAAARPRIPSVAADTLNRSVPGGGRQRQGALQRQRLRLGQPGDQVGEGSHARGGRRTRAPPRSRSPDTRSTCTPFPPLLHEGLRLAQKGRLPGARRPDQGQRAAVTGRRPGEEPVDGRDLGLPVRGARSGAGAHRGRPVVAGRRRRAAAPARGARRRPRRPAR